MISTVKSNKSIMLDKSKRFRKTLGGYNKHRKVEYSFPEATPEYLLEIKNKLKKENQMIWLKTTVTFIIVLGGLLLYFLAK